MPPTSRAERRRDIERRVVEVGRRHLASDGAAGLSLRAVTRELGMVSSAVYRYVAGRDELLTLLLVDAYGELADAVDEAVAAAADRPWDERVVVAGAAFRAWAVADPASYALLYGSPVPGYEAPAERTVEPGTRVTLTLLRLLAEGVEAGEVTPAGPAPVGDTRLLADLERLVAETGLPGGADVMGRALLLWATLVGGTSLEVFGQYGRDTLTAPGALLEHQLRLALAVLRAP
ncbi:MAG: TetR/AcrR family transcriptional regulator [Micrococcales bacterium]|nr:TetR/AcrR family transcriptional regulator [Micrococcales bacterium]